MEVIEFVGAAPGMTVVDVIAAGGWYTEALTVAVGPKGKVYAQNNDFVLAFSDGANEKAITAGLAGDRLPNVARINSEIADTGPHDDHSKMVFVEGLRGHTDRFVLKLRKPTN